jgi:hypothetical protein
VKWSLSDVEQVRSFGSMPTVLLLNFSFSFHFQGESALSSDSQSDLLVV